MNYIVLYLMSQYFAISVILFQFSWNFTEDSLTLRLIVDKYWTQSFRQLFRLFPNSKLNWNQIISLRDEGSDRPNRSVATVCDCAEWLVYGARVLKQAGFFYGTLASTDPIVHVCTLMPSPSFWTEYDSFPQRNVIDSQIYIITAVSGPAVYRSPFTGRITTKKRVSDALLFPREE